MRRNKLFLIVSLLLIFATGALAQRPKASPTPKKPKSIPISEPVVISRADDDLPQPQGENSAQSLPPKPSETPQPAENPFQLIQNDMEKLDERVKKLNSRLGAIESKDEPDLNKTQKKMLLNLEILARAEQRAESLRKQLFELIEKENDVKTKMDDLEYQSRSEVIERSTSLSGSLRPEDLREQRKKSIETQKSNMRALLTQIQAGRLNLEDSLAKADQFVLRVREKIEKELDDALNEDPK